ncbi:heme peroxidase [Chytriomyces cf. hyalinus JEL632]|nr:heme peroxidase [Chytriomyces cf. hyalinus JEL632]
MNLLLLVLAAAVQCLACPFAQHGTPSPHSHARRADDWNPYYTNNMTIDQWASLRSTLSEYIGAGYGPFFVRQAYADAATGGGGHAQRWAIDRKSFNVRDLAMVDSVKANFPDISLADLVSFAGALSVTAMGGPTINWRAGRNDAKTALDAPINLTTASAKATDGVDELRAFFSDRLGLSDRDIVALMGAHNLGNCHVWKSGYAGPWSSTPFNLTNEYFQLLQYPENYTTEYVLSASGTKMQFIDNSGRMMLPVDMALTKDETFFALVQEYAANQATFFADFASAYGRLLETSIAAGLSKNVVSTSLAVAQTSNPSEGKCYPNTGNPIFCVEQFDDAKGNVIFTVHTNRQGWVGLGVGSGSMIKNDVIVGYASQSGIGGVQTSRFRTVQHKVIPNTKSAWQQIPLHPSSNKPAWSNISFSAVHRKVIESTTGLVGNNLNGFLTFAVSDFAPEKDATSAVDGVATLYQHDISAILVRGTGGATMVVGDESTATSMSVGVIGGIAAGAAVVVILAVLAIVFRKRMFGRAEKVPTTSEAPEAPAALPETLQHHSDTAWLKSQYAAEVRGPLTIGSQSSAGDSAPPSFLPDVTYHQMASKSEKQSQLFSAFGPVTLGSASGERNVRSDLPSISGASGTAYSVNEAAENAAFEQKLKQYLDGNITLTQDVSTWDRAAVAFFVMKNGGNLVSAARVRDENFVGAVLLAPTFTITDLTFALAIEKLGDKVIFETAMLALRERGGGGVRKHEPPAYI